MARGSAVDRAAPPGAPARAVRATSRHWHRRRRERRLRAVLYLLIIAVVGLAVGGIMGNERGGDRVADGPAEPAPAPAPPPPSVRAVPPPDAADAVPAGSAPKAGRFAYAGGYGPVLGTAGPVRRFRVAVEENLGEGDGGDFAGEVDRILGDPRSWIAGRRFRFQRVPHPADAEFTIFLASAGTSERMCARGGLRTEGFTSCRLPGQVIINHDRWRYAVPDYGAPLRTYRAYAINHEVGHQLGHGHEACAGRGEPAPVMMQQTYGLKGCVANSWPYLHGRRYAGNPVD
ncbi:DUF3152 domain-containing protein [Amorphoplanes digitatis]|uniref:DUF3152 domain-containing protein n=1 Tax=Actinoplanes digitatis TaxID=1868 RepID=A0A7W7I5D0_9ACTN|nr:DUF3152 domain-containing protein [Actinoplanes digitatis]MBB4766619.1 hypothetical protein [Actinoplanes digitatis]